MIQKKVMEWVEKLKLIAQIHPKDKKYEALDKFFAEDLEAIGLKPGDYMYHDVTRAGVRRRDFIYGEEEDGSDVVIHVWTHGSVDKVRICAHSIEEYEDKE